MYNILLYQAVVLLLFYYVYIYIYMFTITTKTKDRSVCFGHVNNAYTLRYELLLCLSSTNTQRLTSCESCLIGSMHK
jgi:hypothetical protein